MDSDQTGVPGEDRLAVAHDALRRGWALTLLGGKKPVLKNWTKIPPATAEDIGGWVAQGHNLGLRTGAVSGVTVIDDDTEDGSGAMDLGLPETVTVLTGSDKRHYYFKTPEQQIGNSASKLHPRVDVRGDGGQVVFVGSIHPETGQPYRWLEGHSPDEIELAEIPRRIIDRLRVSESPANGHGAPRAARARSAPPLSVTSSADPDRAARWAEAALRNECARVASTPEGDRNNALNLAAFRVGQVLHILARDPTEELLAAGLSAGLPEREARATIASGLGAGKLEPRSPAEPPEIEFVTCEEPAQPGWNGAAEDEHHDEDRASQFAAIRKEIELRDGVAWMPDIVCCDTSGEVTVPFDPHAVPFKDLLRVAEQAARGHLPPEAQKEQLRLAYESIELVHCVKLGKGACARIAVWFMVQRDRVPETNSHLTMTEAADRLDHVHGGDLLWSAVGGRILHWTDIYWAHDQIALGQQWTDEIAQTVLAEWETLETIANRLDKGHQSPELLANLLGRYPVKAWSSAPDGMSKGAREKEKSEALAHLQGLGLDEDIKRLCWRVDVAAFLRGRARQVEKLYRRLETPKGIEDLMEKVRYRHQVPEEAFDQGPFLLVAKNGVIDLHTCTLIEPDRSKLLTKQAGAEFRPGYTHPKWIEAVKQWSGGDEILERWLRAAAGYTLIGQRGSGRFVFVIHGPKRTGKSTFLLMLANALGDYASPFGARAFAENRHSSHDEDLASLSGTRMVYANEMGSARLDAERIKAASSGDRQRVSRKGEKSFDMVPSFAIWMATNVVPRLPSDDDALWDRLRFIAFTNEFELSGFRDELGRDPDFLAAVLAWAVEGANDYLAGGLPECPHVTAQGAHARKKANPLDAWIEERISTEGINGKEPFTSTRVLYQEYQAHAKAIGERAETMDAFSKLLKAAGFAPAKNDSTRGWRVRLANGTGDVSRRDIGGVP